MKGRKNYDKIPFARYNRVDRLYNSGSPQTRHNASRCSTLNHLRRLNSSRRRCIDAVRMFGLSCS